MEFHLAEIKTLTDNGATYNPRKSECGTAGTRKGQQSTIDSPSKFVKYSKEFPKDACIHCLNKARQIWPNFYK